MNPLLLQLSNHRLISELSKGHKPLPEMGDFLSAVLSSSFEVVLANCLRSHQRLTCLHNLSCNYYKEVNLTKMFSCDVCCIFDLSGSTVELML